MFKKILVPLDGSRFGLRALHYGADVAARYKAELVLLEVIKPTVPIMVSGGIVPGVENPTSAELEVEAALAEDERHTRRARRYLGGKVRGLKKQDIDASYHILTGDPATSIMEFCKKEKIDLVVMTTHGKTGFRRAIMGSVADKVIRESGEPVLVIRPKKSRRK